MQYLLHYPDVILKLVGQHLLITLGALLVSVVIALPLGWLLYQHKKLADVVMGILGFIYTIPSIALMIFIIPFLGLNAKTVIAAIVLYCQVILVRNVLAGLKGIDPAVLEAARGMGMDRWQIAWKVQLPLALPVILAGVRIAAVVSVAIATVGAKFGSGGLGVLLFDGIAQAGRYDKIWIGAILVGLIAFLLNRGLLAIEKRFTVRQNA
ncbi:MAG: ABC transporter permease [Anaerolineaceae bacterium]|jgi:osmoprotectant transport system permease protein